MTAAADAAKSAARTAEANPVFRRLARAGYAVNGLVHILVGVLALVVAFGGDGETDQAGAFKAIAGAPLGFVLLWVMALALWALGAWHAVDGLLAPGSTAHKWGRRTSEWSQSLVFFALGVLSASVALGARPDADETAEAASRGVLTLPGGPLILGATGLGIGIGGIVFIWMGVRRSFEKTVRIPAGSPGAVIVGFGVVGFVAKGVALAIVGILLLVAAAKTDPSATGGLDAALVALLALPYGPWLVGAIGAGLIVYGTFCFFRARFARL